MPQHSRSMLLFMSGSQLIRCAEEPIFYAADIARRSVVRPSRFAWRVQAMLRKRISCYVDSDCAENVSRDATSRSWPIVGRNICRACARRPCNLQWYFDEDCRLAVSRSGIHLCSNSGMIFIYTFGNRPVFSGCIKFIDSWSADYND